jgi:hypothetical protein
MRRNTTSEISEGDRIVTKFVSTSRQKRLVSEVGVLSFAGRALRYPFNPLELADKTRVKWSGNCTCEPPWFGMGPAFIEACSGTKLYSLMFKEIS